jgi:ATP-dependent helicase/nuclease subunit A
MDQGRAEIRIMTAHAAKGLEAPVVFLVDNGNPPFIEQHMPRLLPIASQKGLWQGAGYLWRAAKEVGNDASRAAAAAIRDKGEDEYRRLLYVGMTRAEDRLVVCGYHGKRAPANGTWHSLIAAALTASPQVETLPDPVTSGALRHRYRTTPPVAAIAPTRSEGQPPVAASPPAWLRQKLPPEPVQPRPLSPSRAIASIEPAYEASGRSPVLEAEEPSSAIARGLAIHKLLQMLPGLPPVERGAAAGRFLERVGRLWFADEREAAALSVARILEDPTFAPIFSESSRAEVAIAGTLPIGGAERSISGKVDRLAVTPSEVLIVDYKTNRPPPATLDEVPEAYVAQLALYRALLAPLYPDRAVRAALLFTETPRLIAVPAPAMDAALARLAAA